MTYAQNRKIKDVYKAVLEGVTPNSLMTTSWTATAKRFASDYERLKLRDGVLVRSGLTHGGESVTVRSFCSENWYQKSLKWPMTTTCLVTLDKSKLCNV